jgi:hypothetical protein
LLTEAILRDVLHQAHLSRTDILLLCLAVGADNPKQVKEIQRFAVDAGVLEAKKWNISGALSRTNKYAIRIKDGWVLSQNGKSYVFEIAKDFIEGYQIKVASKLRESLAKLSDANIASFVEEAIICYERSLYRAAVVFSWVGAVAILYDYIVHNKILEFNAEATRRDPKWKNALTADDLARMKENDFLDVLEAISVLGKSTKQELKNCLQLRNGCGHPNSLQIGESRVASHLETLVLNVYARFT